MRELAPGALLTVYGANFKAHIALQRQYWAVSAIWLLGTILQPIVSLTVWSAVARRQSGAVAGYAAADFAAYYLALMVVSYLTATGIMFEFEAYVREGTLAAQLLRPIHPIHSDLAGNLTYKLLMLPLFVPALALLVAAFRPTPPPAWTAVAAFALALAFSFVLRFTAGWTIALAAFWMTRTSAVTQIYYVATVFLSGSLAPLALLPAPLTGVAALLPFRWMIAFPIDALLGRLTARELLLGFAAQAGWAIILIALFALIWRVGVRRFTAVGA